MKGAGESVAADSGPLVGMLDWFEKQNGEFDLDVVELEVPLRSHIEMFSGKQKAWRC